METGGSRLRPPPKPSNDVWVRRKNLPSGSISVEFDKLTLRKYIYFGKFYNRIYSGGVVFLFSVGKCSTYHIRLHCAIARYIYFMFVAKSAPKKRPRSYRRAERPWKLSHVRYEGGTARKIESRSIWGRNGPKNRVTFDMRAGHPGNWVVFVYEGGTALKISPRSYMRAEPPEKLSHVRYEGGTARKFESRSDLRAGRPGEWVTFGFEGRMVLDKKQIPSNGNFSVVSTF